MSNLNKQFLVSSICCSKQASGGPCFNNIAVQNSDQVCSLWGFYISVIHLSPEKYGVEPGDYSSTLQHAMAHLSLARSRGVTCYVGDGVMTRLTRPLY